MNILSLPDEALSLIMHYLKASDTTGSFNQSRHAFQLAQTNKRFYRLFADQITRIMPQIANDTPNTLSPEHFLSVIRLVEPNLKELHLPQTFHKILPQLVDLCPRLEKLVFIDCFEHKNLLAFRKLLAAPTRSLCVHLPAFTTLEIIAVLPAPEELCLTKLTNAHIPYLIKILRHPPKRLHLEVMDTPKDPELQSCLHEICAKMDEVSVSAFHPRLSRHEPPFMEKALPLLQKPRYNSDSKCRKLKLEGQVMDLIKHAHPQGIVELTRQGTTFVGDEHGIYLKKLHISCDRGTFATQKFALTQDLSRLKEVYLGDCIMRPWVRLLRSLQLEKISFGEHTVIEIWKKPLHADIIIVPSLIFDGRTYWDWLLLAKKVEIINCKSFHERFMQIYHSDSDIATEYHFFKSLLSLIEQFQGNVLWMDSYRIITLQRHNLSIGSLLRKVRRAVNIFEARGGDAGTVRAQLDCIKWL